MASRVVVMYGGEVVEQAPVKELFARAHHPYTLGLLAAMPRLGADIERLQTIPGTVPPPTDWPSGCRFRDRCDSSWTRCTQEHPALHDVGTHHTSRCHLALEPGRRAKLATPAPAVAR